MPGSTFAIRASRASGTHYLSYYTIPLVGPDADNGEKYQEARFHASKHVSQTSQEARYPNFIGSTFARKHVCLEARLPGSTFAIRASRASGTHYLSYYTIPLVGPDADNGEKYQEARFSNFTGSTYASREVCLL